MREIPPLNFSTGEPKEVPGCSRTKSEDVQAEALWLLQKFFDYLLFDFDIKRVVNAVPVKQEGLHEVYQATLDPLTK